MAVNINLGLTANAGGTVDIITATYSPAVTALTDRLVLIFRATGANTSTTPTFSPNGLTARTIVKKGGQALAAGDIAGNRFQALVIYDLANTRWELLNPATDLADLIWQESGGLVTLQNIAHVVRIGDDTGLGVGKLEVYSEDGITPFATGSGSDYFVLAQDGTGFTISTTGDLNISLTGGFKLTTGTLMYLLGLAGSGDLLLKVDNNGLVSGVTTLPATVTGTKSQVGLGNVDNTSDANKPVSTAQQTALDLKANLASPALTGNPTAPTQAAGDNSTKVATTAYVKTAIDQQPEVIAIACSDLTSNLTTGTSKGYIRMPFAMTLTSVRASVIDAPTGASLLTVDINEAGVTILSTKITIDASEKTSTTAATAPVISDTALADDAEITVDIDQIGSTNAGKGLIVYLIGTRT